MIAVTVLVFFFVIWIVRSDKTAQEAVDQQVADQVKEDDALSPENLPYDADPVIVPLNPEDQVVEESPDFPRTGFSANE
jgi:hypothetical protein